MHLAWLLLCHPDLYPVASNGVKSSCAFKGQHDRLAAVTHGHDVVPLVLQTRPPWYASVTKSLVDFADLLRASF